MIKFLTALLTSLFISHSLYAKQIQNFDEALNLVFDSLQEHHLINLPVECLNFSSQESEDFYYIEISELYNEECSNYMNSSPLLIRYEINKITGEATTLN